MGIKTFNVFLAQMLNPPHGVVCGRLQSTFEHSHLRVDTSELAALRTEGYHIPDVRLCTTQFTKHV